MCFMKCCTIYDNAVRYTNPGGHIYIYVGKNREGKAYYRVEDDGIGIPKSEQKRIFERFYRVDKSHSRQTGGTGLGLSIVKHGATLHHAQIHVDSDLGKGKKWLLRLEVQLHFCININLTESVSPLDKLQLAQCILICHNNCIGMELKDGSRALWGNRSFDRSGESLGFVLAVSYKKNGLCAHNIAGSYRNSLARYILLACKKTLIRLDGSLCKIYTVCASLEMVVWFIKSDVAIRSYSKKLKVCSSYILKQCIVSFAADLWVLGLVSVRNIGILNIYIDSAEQVLVHEVTVALVIGSVQSYIFVQVHRLYMGKIKYSLFHT